MSHQQIIEKIKKDLSEDVFVIDALRDTFKAKTALVISAGPSADNWQEVYEKEKHNSPVIVCIKQTLNLVDIPCDIHFINSSNLIKYKYQPNTLSIMTRNSKAAPVFGKYDIEFQLMAEFDYKPEYYLATNRCFDCYTLDRTGMTRPKGPGIMHESVFYTLAHMGVNKIITVGWDIADSEGKNSHFGQKDDGDIGVQYKPKGMALIFERISSKLGLLKLVRKAGFIKRYMIGALNYHLGKKVNLAGMEKGEAEVVSNSLPSLFDWLEKSDIEITVNTKSKWMKSTKGR
ncbi:MAG: DUF115 domain-containing protein [Oceanospirillales bacterium]|nr:DUF115 domain-containing protein [Oceanospirillales bacterium]